MAMLEDKNKSVSLCWELNSFFMQIMQNEIILFCPPAWLPCHLVENQQLPIGFGKSLEASRIKHKHKNITANNLVEIIISDVVGFTWREIQTHDVTRCSFG